jgi:monooxygenase
VTVDVAIVGAGIGGAVLAFDLAQRGWSVTVVERELEPPRHVRPEILWGATPAALDRLGVGDLVRGASVRLDSIDVANLATATRRDFEVAHVEAFSTHPTATRTLLVAAAVATGRVDIQRGVEVRTSSRAASGTWSIRGRRSSEPFELDARLVVGDDGAHSVVRASAGITLDAPMFPIDFFTAAIRWPASLPADRVRVFLERRSHGSIPAVTFFPWPAGEGVLLFPMLHANAERWLQASADTFWSALARTVPFADALRGELTFPRDFVRTRRPFGHAPRYVADGLAILGDAAHPMSPVGGQGANAAIADALALAEVADAALRANDVSAARLAAYEVRRRPANERSVGLSRLAARLVRWDARVPLAWLIPMLLRTANALVVPKRQFLRTAATSFVDRGARSVTPA